MDKKLSETITILDYWLLMWQAWYRYLTCPHNPKFPSENEHLTLNDWLITDLSNIHLPAMPPHLAFHALHPNEKFPDSQITQVSWGGKKRSKSAQS